MKTPTVARDACGTTAGYNRHRKADEAPCKPCKEAEATRTRERRERIGRPERKPSATETAQELDFLLSIGQGWGPAMRSVGYTKPTSLARRLNRIGRRDLARIFEDQSDAA